MQLPDLPISYSLPELKNAIFARSVVLAAPPGSGKTTIVPLSLLGEPWLAGKKIIILEPRRLATRAAAGRMAFLLGEKVGQTVGYQVRFDRQVSDKTRIEVVTEGILTRRLQNDPDLRGVGLIIFDEFHERSVHADLALALCLDLCQVKDDVRLLVMSATLDTVPLATLLGNVPVIIGEGESYGVEVEYLQHQQRGRIADVTIKGVRKVILEQQGDLLVFLPGVGEIREVHRKLSREQEFSDILFIPLFGNLSQKEQDSAIQPDSGGRRRVILATSIAETSLTIEGIRCVVDSGWSRRPQFSPGNGLSKLTTVRVSRAAASQRAGRAGRLGPGYCLRLWTKAEQLNLLPFHPPEILSVDLAGLVLQIALWGISDPKQLQWLDPPRTGNFQQAQKLLVSLGAIDEKGTITANGKKLAALPLHPRLGHMLLQAEITGQLSLACDLAAILSERDLLKRGRRNSSADLRLRYELLTLFRKNGADAVSREGGDPVLCKRIGQVAGQWRQMVQGKGRKTGKEAPLDIETMGSLLVHAYPDRIARRRKGQRENYLLASGRGALLPPADPLSASEYLIIPHLDAGEREGRVFLAESLDMAELKRDHAGLFSFSRQVFWDDSKGKVEAIERLSLGEIVVEEKKLSKVSPEEVMEALLLGLQQKGYNGQGGISALNWTREVYQLQARVMCLRRLQPEVEWPDLSEDYLQEDLSWLVPWLSGIDRVQQLKKIDLSQVFKAMLGWEKEKKLEKDAPVSITVPSGSKIRIEYRLEEPPLLAVRIQEMFGLATTPTLCGGRLPLLLHLLSPARRPVQVTSDLAGFWQNSYPEVKKELKGRYPKHFWPDDPLKASATRGVKRNMNRQGSIKQK